MSLNSRQRRARAYNLAIRALAKVRDPSRIATEGRVRSVWGKTLPPVANIRNQSWEGSGQAGKSVKGRVMRPKKPLYRADGSPVKELPDYTNEAPTGERSGVLSHPVREAYATDTVRVSASKLIARRREAREKSDTPEAIAERLKKPFTGRD